MITEALARFPIAAAPTERWKIFDLMVSLCRARSISKQISWSLRLLLDACGNHSYSARKPLKGE